MRLCRPYLVKECRGLLNREGRDNRITLTSRGRRAKVGSAMLSDVAEPFLPVPRLVSGSAGGLGE